MVSREVPRFDLNPKAHRIGSDAEALVIARQRRLPAKELDRFSGSGLWAITVPKAYGGADVSIATLAQVVAIISAADPSLGQLPQNHFAALDAIRMTATEEQKRLWFGRALQGYRLGNAFSEANSRHVGAFETTILPVPAMAAATEPLGFGVTVTLSYEPPFPFARRMSALDHLTNGRIGWNIVTGYLDSAAKGMGQGGQRRHDDRYAVAEDYMQVVSINCGKAVGRTTRSWPMRSRRCLRGRSGSARFTMTVRITNSMRCI